MLFLAGGAPKLLVFDLLDKIQPWKKNTSSSAQQLCTVPGFALYNGQPKFPAKTRIEPFVVDVKKQAPYFYSSSPWEFLLNEWAWTSVRLSSKPHLPKRDPVKGT